MNLRSDPRPVLVFGYGNPSRGDDALGPLLIERLQGLQRQGTLEHVHLLTDFQPQVEHALDLQGRRLVVFLDADESCPAPFTFNPILPQDNFDYTTHRMAAEALLAVFEQIEGRSPPAARLMAIRGYSFQLGGALSKTAHANLEQAFAHLVNFLQGRSADRQT